MDYYKLLQVVPTADLEVIRAAYRSLARKYHPDLSGGSLDRMAALNDAWSVLRDPVMRETYDRALAQEAASRSSQQTARWHAAPSAASTWGRASETAGPPRSARSEGGTSPSAGTPAATPNERTSGSGGASRAVLDFGRYAGLSIAEIALRDPDYLEWFARTPIGRRFRPEIDARLHKDPAPGGAHAEQARRGIFLRRYGARLSHSG